MADLPIQLDAALGDRLARALDVEGKIARGFETLGPVADRDVLLLDGVAGGIRATELETIGARVTAVDGAGLHAVADGSFDAVIACWSTFGGADPDLVAAIGRVLRPGGRLLVLHDYGRDDVSRILGDRPAYGAWSRRDGPFLRGGFKMRVLHCFWTFDSIEAARRFLDDAFGDVAREVSAAMVRPRLSYNVAIYHRSF